MTIKLPDLPFTLEALEPHISRRTLEFHYGKHHEAYVKKLNQLITGTPFENYDLVEIVKATANQDQFKNIFNNAAQVWNHNFFWQCLGKSGLSAYCREKIEENFGSMEEFKNQFKKSASQLFGSGWTWMVKNLDGKLCIINTKDAQNPLTEQQIPILTCDVWEHAYYLDYQNDRGEFIHHFWEIINWNFVEINLEKGETFKDNKGQMHHRKNLQQH